VGPPFKKSIRRPWVELCLLVLR